MRIWEKKEDGGWDASGTTFCGCLWDLCELHGKVEHVDNTFVVDAYTKGRRSHTFPLSAKAHSPDVHLPICSHALGLEHGWSCTAKSSCIQKRCYVACNRSQSTSYLRDCSAELMAKRLAPASFLCHKDVPYVSPTSSLYEGQGPHRPLRLYHNPSQSLGHGASHRRSRSP